MSFRREEGQLLHLPFESATGSVYSGLKSVQYSLIVSGNIKSSRVLPASSNLPSAMKIKKSFKTEKHFTATIC